ncbi:MAG: hypothetical protein SVG88_12775 [Halobacteriales archaeon]|nr:hypothetical protein [Halobacteriales archaeon]
MAMVVFQLPSGGGLIGSFAQVAVIAGTVVLILMLVAFGGFVYKSLQGDGIEWPDDKEQLPDDDEIRQGDQDDEWDYY